MSLVTPSYASKQLYLINARSRGDHNKIDLPTYNGVKRIISKPMFRSSTRSRRCLVIADAFIKDPKKEKLSKPYCVYKTDRDEPFAGIWYEQADQSSGEIIRNFAIITTTTNNVLYKIGHHRAPVTLNRDEERSRVNTDADLNEITSLLKQPEDGSLNAYPTSVDVKKVSNDRPEFLLLCGECVLTEYEFTLHCTKKLII